MGKCKTCEHFEREIRTDILNNEIENEEQLGGYCKTIAIILGMSNIILSSEKNLYVYDNFGCILYREKK